MGDFAASFGSVSPYRVAGFGLDRFVSVALLRIVPLAIGTAPNQSTLFVIAALSVAVAIASILAGATIGQPNAGTSGASSAAITACAGICVLAGIAIGMSFASGSEVPLPLFAVGLVALGTGSARLVLGWGHVFSNVGARTAMVEVSLGYFIACALLIPLYALPTVGRICLLSTSVVANCVLSVMAARRIALTRDSESPANPSAQFPEQPSLSKVYLTFFLFGAAMACFGQFQASYPNVSTTVNGAVLQGIIAAIATSVILLVVMKYRSRAMVKAYRLVFLATVLGCLASIALSWGESTTMTLALAGKMTLMSIISALLFELAHRMPHSAATILSRGMALHVTGDLTARVVIEVARTGCGVTLPSDSWILLFVVLIVCTYAVTLPEAELAIMLEGTPLMQRGNEVPEASLGRQHQNIPRELDNLTDREREVLGFLLAGRSSRRIQEELFISESTANTHIRHIYQKLEVHSRQELLDLFERR